MFVNHHAEQKIPLVSCCDSFGPFPYAVQAMCAIPTVEFDFKTPINPSNLSIFIECLQDSVFLHLL